MTTRPLTPWKIFSAPDGRLRRRDALTAAAVAVAALVAGSWLYAANAPDVGIVRTELGGRGLPDPLPAGTSRALWWDFAFIAGYAIALAAGLFLARWVGRTSTARLIVRIGAVAAIAVVAADCIENALLLTVAHQPDLASGGRAALLEVAATAAVLKFCLALPAILVAATAMTLVVVRSIGNRPRALATWVEHAPDDAFWPARPMEDDPDTGSSRFDVEPVDGVRWRAGFDVPDPSDASGGTGFCLSGGGIRAGSVALGALQSLREELIAADQVVSVSGGGFTAGALVQALTESGSREVIDSGIRDPHQALMPGSADEDHIRKRSSYLTPTTSQLVLALGMVLRHLLLTVAVLFGPAVVAGILAGWFYRHVPIAGFKTIDGGAVFHFSTDLFPVPVFYALGVPALAAVACWLLAQGVIAHGDGVRYARILPWTKVAGWLTAVVLAVGVAIPLIVCAADWLLGSGRATTISIAGPVGSVLVTYVSTIAAVAWRNRKTITQAVTATGGSGNSVVAAVPTGFMQRLLVAVALGVLGAGWLLLFAGMVRTWGDPAALWTALGVGIAVVIVGGFMDETTLSLHPFYRKRLASAFAVRTVRRRDEQIVADGYRPEEITTLSTYGRVAPEIDFPSFVFAATANLNGHDRTPPGRNCVSYTFNADWVGGPDVGWVRTPALIELATPRLRRDLTVQGAVAISGAAFASAMGKGARWSQLLLAITGARLGAWLPNPSYLQQAVERAAADDWLNPRLPSTRRLSYLLREIFDRHPITDRLVQVTDGGHYDNLGLVELIRHGCDRIFCIDASGDTPPTATTLAQAIALAHDELGVEVRLDDRVFACEQGMGRPIEPTDPLQTLNARLCRSPVVTGTITYPPSSPYRDRDGRPLVAQLVFGKALLWRDLPYWLLSYAAKHRVFPHDSTGDQWFDAEQFSAYTALGRELGERMRAQVRAPAHAGNGRRRGVSAVRRLQPHGGGRGS